MKVFWVVGTALLGILLVPGEAHAWTPGTHIFLGEAVLATLSELPSVAAEILRAFPYDFLYGNIAADTSIAKKYAPVGRHCHSWHVGQEIYQRAPTPSLSAFGLGYLSHLAADTVAHNFYVPHQLVVASRTIALGHSWWESRFETHIGDQYAREAMDVIRRDHSGADAHLDEILSPTIFSVRTSRRIFRGMVGVTESQSWQAAFRTVARNSRWDLSDGRVEAHMALAYQFVMEVLAEAPAAAARRLDPSGDASLRLAKRIRVDVLRNRIDPNRRSLTKLAHDHFGLPEHALHYWTRVELQKPWSLNGQTMKRPGALSRLRRRS